MTILNVITITKKTRSEHFVTFMHNGKIKQDLFTQYHSENIPLKQIILNSLTAD